MNEAVKWTLAYLGTGLLVATLFGCWCRLGRWSDHLSEYELEGLWAALLLWPLVILALPVAAAMAAADVIQNTSWWKRLPDSKDLYPVEWLFCWPTKLYELWRRRNDRRKENGEGDGDGDK